VDRDNKPVWEPSSLAGVTQEQVNAFFEPLGENELKL
jgi:enoyl-CoA hydratase